MVEVDVAARLPLCKGLSREQVTAMAAQLHMRTVPPGTTLMMVEQAGEVAYLIYRGTVKISVDQDNGTEVILSVRGPGELVGEMSLIDREGRSANVVTLEDCTLIWVDRSTFGHWLETIPALTMNVLRLLSRRLRLANAQNLALATLDVHGRVARQILAFADEYGEPAEGQAVRIPLRLTQGDLAAMVGASRVRVNEAVGAFKRRGLIGVDARHQITVHDPEALARHCQSFQLE